MRNEGWSATGRRPVPDALRSKGDTRGNKALRCESRAVESRDRRWDEPCSLTGYQRRLAWNYTQTDDDDPAKASFVDALWQRLHHG